MKRFLSSILTLGMLLTPSLSLAEFTRPSDLFLFVSTNPKPMSFSGEAHGNMDAMWYSVWLSGSGKGTGAEDMEAQLKGTVDVAMNNGKARVKFQVRIVEGHAYIYVDSIEGSYEDTVWKMLASIRTKTWLKVALPPDFTVAPQPVDLLILDDLLNVSSKPSGNEMVYELTLTREAAREMLKNIRADEYAEWDDAYSALPRTATFRMTVSTNSKDEFVQAAGAMEMAGRESTFALKGSAWTLSDVQVTVPTNAISLEEWMKSIEESFANPFSMPSPSWEEDDDWKDSTEEEDSWESPLWEEYSSDDWEDSSTDMIPEWDCRLNLDAVRHGECDTFERTPRRLP